MNKVLVLGAGAAGIQAALSEAAAGNKVTVAEHFPSFGGERIPQDRILTDGDGLTAPDLTAFKSNDNIEFLFLSEKLVSPLLHGLLKCCSIISQLLPEIHFFCNIAARDYYP